MSKAAETVPAHTQLFRVHRDVNGPAFYDNGRHGRFNPPENLTTAFGTLYLARSPGGAFIETLGRNRYVTDYDLELRRLTTCSFVRELHLFSVAAPLNRFRYDGIDLGAHAVATTSDYSLTQHLAGLVWADPNESFDGIVYRARHDNSLRSTSVALFGEPGGHSASDIFAQWKTEPVPDALVDEMIELYGFEVVPATDLP
jgi:RES domain